MRILVIFFGLMGGLVFGQKHHPTNGPADKIPTHYTLTGATIIVSPGKELSNASLTINQGKIVAVNKGKTVPEGSVEIPMQNRVILPAFIEPYAEFEVTELAFKSEGASTQQLFSQRENHYWNDHIRPEIHAIDYSSKAKAQFEKYRNLGFGAVNFHQNDGIARGTSVLLMPTDDDKKTILKNHSAQHFALKRGSSEQSYPTSLMGQFALLRQFFADANWYKKETNTTDLSLDAYLEDQPLPHILDLRNSLNYNTASKLGKNFIYVGDGNEFEIIDEIDQEAKFILPLNFPKAYEFEDEFDKRLVSLNQLKRWKQAPFQPKLFADKNIHFAFTSRKIEDGKTFMKNIRKAIANGLNPELALSALTTRPAQLLGMENVLGTIENGKIANFLVFTANPFLDDEALLSENWVAGKRHVIEEFTTLTPGKYVLELENKKHEFEVQIKDGEPKVKSEKIEVEINENPGWITLSIKKPEPLKLSGALVNNSAEGFYNDKEQRKSWKLELIAPEKTNHNNQTKSTPEKPYPITYPNVAYGFSQKPKTETILIKNATVWTMEKDGVLNKTDVLVKNGKIAQIGENLNASRARIVDGTGKHLTPGMIDEHSHAGIRNGVNEAGWNMTAEVRIGDVLNPLDANLFRQMARGVTTSQLLHGSANPVGGQSQLIKLRWGESAEGLKFEGAPKFIKFALGENVKQSNWGFDNPTRYPQTRLGVEQTFEDGFRRAKAYDENSDKNKRIDYRLEALAEIINSERFITCHSYVQSEILMLMRLAERFGFRVQTFTHILEGYKLAKEMREHGVGASTFSDWWAYKFEVNDAIPHNAAILSRAGVNTAINSDDREMAQRLNQEAAKMIKYAGATETEAMAMITINPAKMLKIDNRVGSIKVGKDADLVLWSGHPLSINALADYTIIDGKIYFERANFDTMKENLTQERNRLIEEMSNTKGEKTKLKPKNISEEYHCDTL